MARRKLAVDVRHRKSKSLLVKEKASFLVEGGKRETDSGYIIDGHLGKLETYYEVLLPGSTTATLCHPKKTRVCRVTHGSGIVYSKPADTVVKHKKVKGKKKEPDTVTKGKWVTQKVLSGDEVAFEPGITYRIVTIGDEIGMFVVQEGKYAAKLVEVSPAAKIDDVPASMLHQDFRSPEEVSDVPKVRYRSRAKEQNARKAISRGQTTSVPTQMPKRGGGNARSAGSVGVNLVPQMPAGADG